MMLAAEEFLYGTGTPQAGSAGLRSWLRPALPWLAVAAAHVVLLGLLLQVSPQARQKLGEVIQAGLIAPQPAPEVKPPETPSKKPRSPRPPQPVLAAAPQAETASSSFLVAAPPAEPAAPVAAPATTPPLVPPVFNAAYLENPPPHYPSMSRRLGEKGRVLLRVLVSPAGRAERVDVHASSGYERLDAAAREAVAGWRFVPARRGELHVAAWVLVPINFVMRTSHE